MKSSYPFIHLILRNRKKKDKESPGSILPHIEILANLVARFKA